MERIFASFHDTGGGNASSYDPGDEESVLAYIHALIVDSRDYEGSTLAPARDYAQKYYYGLLPTLNGDKSTSETTLVQNPNDPYEKVAGQAQDNANRSTFVSTDVKDAVMLMLPSLIRLFGSNESPVQLVPRSAAESQQAEQATNYVNYVFWNDNDGFLNLYGAFKDALTVRTGFLKWWTDNQKERRRKTYQGITSGQLQSELLQADPTARIVSHSGIDPMTGMFESVTVEYQVAKPITKIMGVPPEEMRLDPYARTFRESRIVGHERVVPVDELVAMGYKREDLLDKIQSSTQPEFTSEAQLRNQYRMMGTRVGDGVMYGEWYIKVDLDNDGIPELNRVITFGEDGEIHSAEPANRIKFAHFSCDPISHTIVGESIADYVMDIQRLKTNGTRAMLDSAAESINPKTVVNELTTNVDDALNDDLGAVIRTRGDPNNAVAFANIPFLGKDMIPVLELFNEVLQRRTGLSDAAKGLDPSALQSSTSIGVQAIINGQQERTELVARVLCETGFKDCFAGLYNEIAENPSQARTLKINGNWVDYDTSTFDASMGVEVNPTLGKGNDTIRLMTLAQIKADQQLVIQQMGIGNPICGIPELFNTQTDILSIANIKNVQRYFKLPDPAALQQIAAAPKEPDAMTLAAQAQFQKVKADAAAKLGDQNLKKADDQQWHEIEMAKLREKASFDQRKLDIEAAKVNSEHVTAMGQMAADIFKTHLEKHTDHTQMGVDADMQSEQIAADKEIADKQAQAAAAAGPET